MATRSEPAVALATSRRAVHGPTAGWSTPLRSRRRLAPGVRTTRGAPAPRRASLQHAGTPAVADRLRSSTASTRQVHGRTGRVRRALRRTGGPRRPFGRCAGARRRLSGLYDVVVPPSSLLRPPPPHRHRGDRRPPSAPSGSPLPTTPPLRGRPAPARRPRRRPRARCRRAASSERLVSLLPGSAPGSALIACREPAGRG